MQDLIIPGSILQELRLKPDDLLVDIAVYLYDQERLSMGRAKKLAGLTQIEFQKAMAERGVYLKYDINDFEADLRTIATMEKNADSQ